MAERCRPCVDPVAEQVDALGGQPGQDVAGQAGQLGHHRGELLLASGASGALERVRGQVAERRWLDSGEWLVDSRDGERELTIRPGDRPGARWARRPSGGGRAGRGKQQRAGRPADRCAHWCQEPGDAGLVGQLGFEYVGRGHAGEGVGERGVVVGGDLEEPAGEQAATGGQTLQLGGYGVAGAGQALAADQ